MGTCDRNKRNFFIHSASIYLKLSSSMCSNSNPSTEGLVREVDLGAVMGAAWDERCCLSLLSAAVIKSSSKSHVQEKGWFSSQFQITVKHCREAKAQELEAAGHIPCTVDSRERWIKAYIHTYMLAFSSRSPLLYSQDPNQRNDTAHSGYVFAS